MIAGALIVLALLILFVAAVVASLLHHQDRHTVQIGEIRQVLGMDQPQQRGRHGA